MFAVIEIGGKQYKVEKGMKLDVEKIDEEAGKSITISKVLLISDGNDTKIGTPTIEGAGIIAKVLEQKRGERITVFKMKAKKRYKTTQGHRQYLTTLEITDIKSSGATTKKAPAKKTEPKKEEAKKEKE